MKQIPLVISFTLCAFVSYLNFSSDANVYGTFMAILSILALAELIRQLTNKSGTQS